MNWYLRSKRALVRRSERILSKLNGPRAIGYRRALAYESLEPRLVLAPVAPGLSSNAQTYSGALNNKIVFTSPGHGWEWDTDQNPDRYSTGRGDSLEIEEAFGNQDQMTMYADYLLRAGATVVPMRPVGRQINEVVLDNDSAGVTFTGSWVNSTSTKYYDEDYGTTGGGNADAISYKTAATTNGSDTSVATYTPTIPESGFYPVYTWTLQGANRTTQLYRVNHTGGTTEIKVDHRKVGNGWVYLGTYHFDAGSSATLGSVQITSNSSVAGNVVADAIRFGNGMGDYTDTPAPGPSGYPREDEASYLWIARSIGIGTTLATAIGAGASNVSAPSNFAAYMFAGTFGEALYMGIHSNAAGGHGAVGLETTDPGLRTPHQHDLATYVGSQINQDLAALDSDPAYNNLFGAGWSFAATGNTTYNGVNFGEIDLGPGAEMDATIAEVAFHDTQVDADILREVNGRDQIARSLLQSTIQYFQNYGLGGVTSTLTMPTPPTNVRAVSNASGQVTINWTAGPTTPSGVYGSAAASFKIYGSVDGYGFDGGTTVAGGGSTSVTLSGYDATRPYYFRVVGVNAGGESKPSEVMTVLPTGGTKQVLIVNGFDRNDRAENFRYPYAYTGDGLVDRVWERYNNSRDYVIQVQAAIQAARPGVHVASTSNEAVISGAVNLNDYDAVIWISGEESTVEETFGTAEQTAVEQFVAGGGHLFVTGAEIGWDLDRPSGPTAADRTFFHNTLKATYTSDDAGTYTIGAAPAAGIFTGLASFSFSNGNAFSNLDDEYYNAEFPDVLTPQAGAITALSYSGGAGSAAVQAQGTGGRGNVVIFGFPFETITDATRRTQIMDRVLGFFNVSTANVSVDIKTRVNGLDADTPTGPVLQPGTSATFTYIVTNLGDVSLTSVVVKDDNGTPGNAADDFNPGFTSGDTNGNNQLDVGETWTYTATRNVVAGQRTDIGSVTATGASQNVSDSDPANYLGASPAVSIATLINGSDADLPPGPTLAAGASGTFAYQVTNSGNVPLLNVVVNDNNGTPGNAADDFNPTFTGGDTNGNNQLDLGETWTYSATRTLVAGQYTGSGSVSATDSFAQNASSSDGTNYFGAVASLDIQSFINGQDADSAPGPLRPTGSIGAFTYQVTNTGNVVLVNTLITDDNGTPGNAADDFNPNFTGGDTNGNGQFDVGETWTYSTSRFIQDGQYSGTASVQAAGGGQGALDSDPVNYFGSSPSAIIETFVAGDDADSPTGPTLAAGSAAPFTYQVTNGGNVPLLNVQVKDNNSTPSAADDFFATYASGDTNSNGKLDLDEAWTFAASRTIIVGQYSGSATVSANDGVTSAPASFDTTNYFGSAPGVHLETLVNGEDADLPTGPVLTAGSTATFTYILTNTGNAPLQSFLLTDDNGTAGNTADDFYPDYVSGDANFNELLDLDETWTFSATHTVTAGQYTNVGSVTAMDLIEQPVNAADAANHFGQVTEDADFNDDGFVDSKDYVLWRKFKGTTVATGTNGDANFDTQVDDDDYAIWVKQYGTSSGGAGGNVGAPEPVAAGTVIESSAVSSSQNAAPQVSTTPLKPLSSSVQDAAFESIAASTTGFLPVRRSTAPSKSLNVAAAERGSLPAILAAITQQKPKQARSEFEVEGVCGVTSPVVERVGEDGNLAHVRVISPVKTSVGRPRKA